MSKSHGNDFVLVESWSGNFVGDLDDSDHHGVTRQVFNFFLGNFERNWTVSRSSRCDPTSIQFLRGGTLKEIGRFRDQPHFIYESLRGSRQSMAADRRGRGQVGYGDGAANHGLSVFNASLSI
jgi:hypothetical protein